MKLTYKARTNLPKSSFIFKKGGPDNKGKFPIPDKVHARNALARAGSKSSAVQTRVRAAVHAKFPSIK